MKIAIGCDQAGVALKNLIIDYLKSKNIEMINKGTDSLEVTNYPLFSRPVTDAIVKREADLGILVCGSGVGMSIAANKVDGIRAVVCSEPYSAKLSREHNNSNVLALGARVVGPELAKMIIDEWLDAEFQGGIHQTRIDMIAAIERGESF